MLMLEEIAIPGYGVACACGLLNFYALIKEKDYKEIAKKHTNMKHGWVYIMIFL